jgi:DNA-binding MarR family transcriptional regulator
VSELRETADRLHSLAIHLLRRLRKVDEATGLSGPRLSALSVVVFAGPVTLTELAAAEQVKPPTMTRLVQGLEAEGLVRRRADAEDGRVSRVEATPRGRKILLDGRARRVEMLSGILASLEPADRDDLQRALLALDAVIRAPRPAPVALVART